MTEPQGDYTAPDKCYAIPPTAWPGDLGYERDEEARRLSVMVRWPTAAGKRFVRATPTTPSAAPRNARGTCRILRPELGRKFAADGYDYPVATRKW
jgi:hypothetical protein